MCTCNHVIKLEKCTAELIFSCFNFNFQYSIKIAREITVQIQTGNKCY